MLASVHEFDTRARNEINDSSREKNLSRFRKSLDSRSGVDSNATDIISTVHDFSSVEPDAYLDTEFPRDSSHAARAADAASRTVESSQRAVSHGLHSSTLEALYLCVHRIVIGVQKSSPTAISQLRSAVG